MPHYEYVWEYIRDERTVVSINPLYYCSSGIYKMLTLWLCVYIQICVVRNGDYDAKKILICGTIHRTINIQGMRKG
jgi:hypothetical protein